MAGVSPLHFPVGTAAGEDRRCRHGRRLSSHKRSLPVSDLLSAQLDDRHAGGQSRRQLLSLALHHLACDLYGGKPSCRTCRGQSAACRYGKPLFPRNRHGFHRLRCRKRVLPFPASRAQNNCCDRSHVRTILSCQVFQGAAPVTAGRFPSAPGTSHPSARSRRRAGNTP